MLLTFCVSLLVAKKQASLFVWLVCCCIYKVNNRKVGRKKLLTELFFPSLRLFVWQWNIVLMRIAIQEHRLKKFNRFFYSIIKKMCHSKRNIIVQCTADNICIIFSWGTFFQFLWGWACYESTFIWDDFYDAILNSSSSQEMW